MEKCCQGLLLDSVVISEKRREKNKEEVYWRCFIWKGIKRKGTLGTRRHELEKDQFREKGENVESHATLWSVLLLYLTV